MWQTKKLGSSRTPRFWVRLHYFATNDCSHKLTPTRGDLLNIERGRNRAKKNSRKEEGQVYATTIFAMNRLTIPILRWTEKEPRAMPWHTLRVASVHILILLLASAHEAKHGLFISAIIPLEEIHTTWSTQDEVVDKLTEFTSFEAMICADFRDTRTSSEPATTRTGRSSTDLSNSAALFGGRTVENERRPTSCSASSQPSTNSGAWMQMFI
jgi:hypothetical protein